MTRFIIFMARFILERAFCYVTGLSYDEWGYVSLTELEEIKHKTFGIPRIERDLYFTPTNFSRVVN